MPKGKLTVRCGKFPWEIRGKISRNGSVFPRVTNFTNIYLLLDQDFQPGPVKSIRSMLRRLLEVASWNKTVGFPWEFKGIDGM